VIRLAYVRDLEAPASPEHLQHQQLHRRRDRSIAVREFSGDPPI
jgi:hypothetical protein